MPKQTRKNTSYNYMYIATALICIIIASIITALITIGNIDGSEETASSAAESSVEPVSAAESSTVSEQSVDTPAGNVSFKKFSVDNGGVTDGNLAVITPSDITFRSSDDLNLKRVYGNKQGTYGLSGTGVMLDEEALAKFDAFLIAFESILPKNGIIIDSGFTSKESLIAKNQLDAYADLTSGSSVKFGLSGSSYSFDSNEFSFLYEQAYKYGIIMRYPAEKAQATSHDGSKVLYRYVGLAHSQYMHIYNLSLEEYLDMLRNNEGRLEIKSTVEENVSYIVYYTKMSAGSTTEIEVPEDAEKYPYQISGDGTKGFVVTVRVTNAG